MAFDFKAETEIVVKDLLTSYKTKVLDSGEWDISEKEYYLLENAVILASNISSVVLMKYEAHLKQNGLHS